MPPILWAQDAGGPESADAAPSKSEASQPPHPWRLSTAHGLVFGRGQQTYNGLHLQDSLSLTGRQNAVGGRTSEILSASSNAGLKSDSKNDSLQDWDIGMALKYKRNGYSVGAEAGLTYSAIFYNKLSRKEKLNAKATISPRFGLSIGKEIALDADSTWETDLAAGYDDMGGLFRTLDASAGLTKTIGEFELEGTTTGYHQNQDQTTTVCKGKLLKACSDSTSASSLRGLGISAGGIWDNDTHAVSVKTELDWQFAADVERTLLMGAEYVFSPTNWLEIGASVLRENNLDVKKNAKIWLAGGAFRLTF